MVQFPEWSTRPIPGVSLSAGGLLALADLSTVAQRTAITGGSVWLDSLLLAPGLHYQQAADELVKRTGGTVIVDAVEEKHDTTLLAFRINNAATANYIQRIAKPGETVTLDVGLIPVMRDRFRLRRSLSGLHVTISWAENDMLDLGWVSHLLYLVSPVLTIAALAFSILLQDWWVLASLLALMLSRLLNIWVIKQRTKRHTLEPPGTELASPPTDPGSDPNPAISVTASGAEHHHFRDVTECLVSLADGRSWVKLRGSPADLRAITTEAWLRNKTHVEGYLEAAAKLIVYLVAAVSGNMTQAGAIIMMALLLSTAGLLALSNAHAKSLKVNGRLAAPDVPAKEGKTRGKDRVTEGKRVPLISNPGGKKREDDKAAQVWPNSSAGGGLSGDSNV
ncbi:hypothetical protein B0H67DRAFT_21001 [Lasiosphaeris hirsuta]|uniref:Uncharacterized protein n=1 Tax=Lasiosphaeris hirsuta TaxID=260670 RepID=A0AA40B9D7_9PEZI|nr:hypothetical protein B0H67DRAFT_21001 [Lasiosphaeris hirsuta]